MSKLKIIRILLNVVASVMFAVGLVFLVPAVSPKIEPYNGKGVNRIDGITYCEIEINSKTKYRIQEVQFTVEYYDGDIYNDKLTREPELIKVETRTARPTSDRWIRWEMTEDELPSENRPSIAVTIDKVVTNNSTDLTCGIVFLCISAISLALLLYLTFSPKYIYY